MSNRSKEIYDFGPFRLDVREHKFERTDGVANRPLPEKAFQTLVVLVRNQGRLITKNELLSAVWPDTIVEENNLDKSIHAIRHVLSDPPAEGKYIETVRKHGYRFVADVRSPSIGETEHTPANGGPALVLPNDVDAAGPAVEATTTPASSEAHDSQARPASKTRATAIVLLLIAASAVGGWAILSGWPANGVTAGKPPSEGSRAYDLYVRGKVRVAYENREDTEAAIALLQEAVAIEPDFAAAHAILARGYNTMAFKFSSGPDTKRFHENAEVAIEKALALDPNLAEAHFARGLILWSNTKGFPHEQTIRSYKRSLELDPDLDETHHQLSLVYSHIGLLDEARESVTRALELNPNNTLARFREGVYIAYQGKFREAIDVFKTIPRDVAPLLVDRSIAEALIQSGEADEAEALVDDHLNRYPDDEGGSFTSVKALLLAKAGRQSEAEDTIRRALAIGSGYGHFHHTIYNVASAYAVMNKPDEAVKLLRDAADSGFPNYVYFENDPNLDNIRRHPLFTDFMKELRPKWERFRAGA